jgi:pyridoxine 5-phosphate synthase
VQNSQLPVNIECSVNPEIIDIICDLKPSRATIVPENRQEVTTEGGLNLNTTYEALHEAVHKLLANEIEVSLFIDPKVADIRGAKGLGVQWVELHTGKYANIYAMLYSNLKNTKHSIKELETSKNELKRLLAQSLEELKEATDEAEEFGLKVAAGHGLNYQNVANIVAIEGIKELNIGQSIVARAIFCGFESAVRQMRELVG